MVQPGEEAIESTEAEVSRVVDLVLEHARTRPQESLGVIALGIKHANRIDEALRRALSGAEGVGDFFDEDRHERFFVKNLERVQGDERDAIILSIGYGKTPHGRVLHRFGPLNLEGGERRLNVAITRARRRMTVVSSLLASDLDPTRLKARGAVMLRDFLAYAESQATALPSPPDGVGERPAGAKAVPPEPVRAEFARRLREAGLVVHEAFGGSAQPIDLAVEDPHRPGHVLVAVETDGPGYAAMHSTRDRDRLRVEQLGRLGWEHVRVWSTDLFRDPARDVARVVALAQRAPQKDAAVVTEESVTEESVAGDSGGTGGPGARDRGRVGTRVCSRVRVGLRGGRPQAPGHAPPPQEVTRADEGRHRRRLGRALRQLGARPLAPGAAAPALGHRLSPGLRWPDPTRVKAPPPRGGAFGVGAGATPGRWGVPPAGRGSP